jgi:hypothetical protein
MTDGRFEHTRTTKVARRPVAGAKPRIDIDDLASTQPLALVGTVCRSPCCYRTTTSSRSSR